MDTKDQNKELCTDYCADGYKNPARRALHGLLSRWYKKSAQRALHRLLSRWIQKTRTKSFTQTIEQMDPKNQNKELYTDSWADGFKKPEQRPLRRLFEQMDTKQAKRKVSGNRHAGGVRGEQRAGEG
jgi:hypothetical protein